MAKRALVVGIDNYRVFDPSGKLNLNKCVNDAKSMAYLLQNAFSFDKIYTYLDRQASKANLLSALRYLISLSEIGDTLCFYYSGHGSRQRSLLKEADCDTYYESIFLGDGTQITDKEMSALTAALDPDVINFTVILDSCHSGGMHGGDALLKCPIYDPSLVEAMVRYLKTLIPFGVCVGENKSALANNVQNVKAGAKGEVLLDLDPDLDKIFIPSSKTTLLAGCQFDESSYIGPSTYPRSVFTQCIFEIANRSNFNKPCTNVLDEVRTKIREKIAAGHLGSNRQTPQLFGQRNRMKELFLAEFSFTPAHI
jgi:hypothetical protein